MYVLINFIIAIAIIWAAWQGLKLAQKIIHRNDCPRCEGKGYWIGVRGKEPCDQCGGSGRRA